MLMPRDRHSSWVSPAHHYRGRHRSPPPVQALESPSRPKTPVLMLPPGNGSPPENGMALTWPTQQATSQEFAESASIKDPSGRDMATYHARAIVTVSPSGETTMHIQSSYYSVRSPDGSGSGMRLHHSPSSGGPRGYSTPGRLAKQLTFPGTPSNRSSPHGSRSVTTTPSRSHSGTPRTTSSDSPKPGRSLLFEPASADSTVRRRNLPALPYRGSADGDRQTDERSRTQRTFRRNGGELSEAKMKRCSNKASYKGILEQDHPEEPNNRGRATICSYICTLLSVLLLLLLILLLTWIFVPFGDPVLKIGMAPKDAITMLKSDIDRHIFGQHIANKLVVSALHDILAGGDIEPVVVSFHGGSGVGKTHMADILGKHFQDHYDRTLCLQTFLSDLHIPPTDLLKVPDYQDLIQNWMNDQISTHKSCKPLFLVFDELRADAPAELTIALSNVLSEIKLRNTVSQPVVVIIMSDIGMHDINTYMTGLWDSGTPRANTTLDELLLLIQNAALFIDSQMQQSVQHTETWPYRSKQGPFKTLLSLVDNIIPFLPLEGGHVKLCIMHDVITKGTRIAEDDLTWVADQLTYFPASSQVFSVSGCKKVSEKVDLLRHH